MQGGSQPGLLSLQRSYLRVPGWRGYKSLFSRQVLSALAVTSSGDKVLLGMPPRPRKKWLIRLETVPSTLSGRLGELVEGFHGA